MRCLKILEEPPDRALLLLVSHNPGRLLPTIRSRCRRLMLAPLPLAEATRLIRQYRPQLDEAEAAALAALCGGSIGRALGLADGGGLALYRSLLDVLSATQWSDPGRLHGFADRLARGDAEDAYRATEELLSQFLARIAAAALSGKSGSEENLDDEIVAGERAAMRTLSAGAGPASWADLHAKIAERFCRRRRAQPRPQADAARRVLCHHRDGALEPAQPLDGWIASGPGPYLGFGEDQ